MSIFLGRWDLVSRMFTTVVVTRLISELSFYLARIRIGGWCCCCWCCWVLLVLLPRAVAIVIISPRRRWWCKTTEELRRPLTVVIIFVSKPTMLQPERGAVTPTAISLFLLCASLWWKARRDDGDAMMVITMKICGLDLWKIFKNSSVKTVG